MIDGIEGCCKVEKNEDGEVSRVIGKEKVICNFEEGCFSALSRSQIERIQEG